jgi:hypothetical protein
MRDPLSILLALVTIATAIQTDAAPPDVNVPSPRVADSAPDEPRRPPAGLLTPTPETGNLPPILGLLDGPTDGELRFRASARKYAQQIRQIRRKCFGPIKVQSIRDQGISELYEFTDPASFRPLLTELADENDDVRLAVLNHLADQGGYGQAALAWTAIYDRDAAMRNEAIKRMTRPASPPVLGILDSALRSRQDSVANSAAAVAGSLSVLEAIPLLIFAQAVASPAAQNTGDLAWIAIETQRSYVANLQPVVGDASGAFAPVIGVVSEGSVLRVVDAVVVAYRTEVHASLVSMTSGDWGQSTEHFAYDLDRWWHWYNEEYVPFRLARAYEANLASDPPSSETAGDAE